MNLKIVEWMPILNVTDVHEAILLQAHDVVTHFQNCLGQLRNDNEEIVTQNGAGIVHFTPLDGLLPDLEALPEAKDGECAYLDDAQKLLELLLPLIEWREKVLGHSPIGDTMPGDRKVWLIRIKILELDFAQTIWCEEFTILGQHIVKIHIAVVRHVAHAIDHQIEIGYQ